MSGTQLFNSHPSQICFYHYRSFYQTIRQCAQKDAQNLLVPHRVRARHLCNCRAPTSQPPPGSLSSSPSTLIQKSGHSPNPLGAPLTRLTLSSGSVRSHSLEHLSFSSFSLSQSAFFLQGSAQTSPHLWHLLLPSLFEASTAHCLHLYATRSLC